jgi:hypothetical protein
LNCADVVAVFEQVGRETVAECVATCRLRDFRFSDVGMDSPLNHGLVKVVSALLFRFVMEVDSGHRKDPFPGPFSSSSWVLRGKRVRQRHPTGTFLKILPVRPLFSAQMS